MHYVNCRSKSLWILTGSVFGLLLLYKQFQRIEHATYIVFGKEKTYGLQARKNHQFAMERTGNDDNLNSQNQAGNLSPRNPRFYNILTEDEALKYTPCTDPKQSASAETSVLGLEGNGTYNIGEEIRVLVRLLDGYGKQRYSGGDHLRATITNEKLKAYAPCVVTDNENGTHSVSCEALWNGKANISVIIAYPKEAVSGLYSVRTKLLATWYICAQFKNGEHTEQAICHPSHFHLLRLTNHTKLCNMTYINSGMPFYCGKPSNVYLLCEDWEMVKPCLPYPTLPWTDCERELIETRGQQILRETVSVTIRNITEYNGELITLPTIPCSSFNLTYLWTSRNPTGFFFNGTWHLRHCQGIQPKQQLDCLQNRTLYLLGDSTIRQWYSRVVDRFGCTPTTERWTKERWHKLAECKNQNLSFVAGWYPHSQPFYVSLGDWDFVRCTLYSIARRIDNIHRNENSVVVIHLYLHVVAYHFSVFRERMVIIRRSVERLLKETTTSKVLIKAHLFQLDDQY